MLVFAAENIPTTASSSSSSPPQPPPPHPLSLLLTCHRTHHESAPLAFHTHAFRLPARAATYIALQARACALSRAHRLTLRTLSTPHGSSAGAQLANALLVFPGLRRFSIHIARARQAEYEWHTPAFPTCFADAPPDDVLAQAVQRYAPFWVRRGIERAVTRGVEYAWQAGERWAGVWAQAESELCYSVVECGAGSVREELRMDVDAVGTTPGVQVCACGCGQVSWTAFTLVQEGGRRVDVEVLYLGEPWVPEVCVPNVVLVPGTEPAAEVVVHEAGLGFSPEEEYWEAMRRRNRNLGAVCRGLWEKAMRPVSIVGLSTADTQAGGPPTNENEKL